MGRDGGIALYKKRGKEWMAEIGKRGFQSLVNKYFGGDRQSAIDWLHSHSTESQIDRLLQEKQAKQIGEGAAIVCEEVPISLWPDDDPTFEVPERSWAKRVAGGRNGKSR
jgi:hypothetical protein